MEKELTLRDADESILVLTTTNLLLVPTEVVLEHLPRNEVRVSFLVWIRLRQFFAVMQTEISKRAAYIDLCFETFQSPISLFFQVKIFSTPPLNALPSVLSKFR